MHRANLIMRFCMVTLSADVQLTFWGNVRRCSPRGVWRRRLCAPVFTLEAPEEILKGGAGAVEALEHFYHLGPNWIMESGLGFVVVEHSFKRD